MTSAPIDLPGERIAERPPVFMFTAPNPGAKTLEGTHTFLIGREKAYIVDPGPDIDSLQQALALWVRRQAHDIRAILLTHGHPDHAPGAATLAGLLDVPIVASPAVHGVVWSPLHVDRYFSPGEAFEVDGDTLAVVETPGHSPDHVAFWLERARILFSGDTILGRGTSLVAPPEGDMVQYMESLEVMRRLAPRLIAPGHGPLVTDPVSRIDEYVAHRRGREEQILAALAETALTPDELVARLYADVSPALHDLARGSVLAQLAKLEAEGRVTSHAGRFARR